MRITFGPPGGGETIQVPAGRLTLTGTLAVPPAPAGLILFAHGSGSSRHSPRNRFIAQILNNAGFATLLLDLLTPEEEELDRMTGHLRFDIPRLAERLVAATDWLSAEPDLGTLPIGYFGASTGAAAALVAAADRPERVRAIVSRGGRPDLAGAALYRVQAPTLLIVGGHDPVVLTLNHSAMERLQAVAELEVVPGATHLFEEPGMLEEVGRLATGWFERHLTGTEVRA